MFGRPSGLSGDSQRAQGVSGRLLAPDGSRVWRDGPGWNVTARGETITAPGPSPAPRGECPAVHPWPSVRHLAAVVLFFLATTTFYTYPLVFRLGTAIMPGAGDYASETALIAWNGRYAFPDPTHLFDTRVVYP
jgi:hypothetical protein